MMRSVHLHGKLKKQFGASFRFDVVTAGEALRALNCAFPGAFVAALQTGSYRLVRGALRTGMSLDLELINALNLGHADLHLIPVAAGAANGKGVAKTVLGVALIGGAIFLSGGTLAAPLSMLSNPVIAGIGVTWGNIATIGLGLTFAGASSLMTKPTTTLDAKADQSKSFNAIAPGDQGNAIPLIYGETVVQGVPISFDSDVEDTRAYANESFPGLFGSVADALVKAGAI